MKGQDVRLDLVKPLAGTLLSVGVAISGVLPLTVPTLLVFVAALPRASLGMLWLMAAACGGVFHAVSFRTDGFYRVNRRPLFCLW